MRVGFFKRYPDPKTPGNPVSNPDLKNFRKFQDPGLEIKIGEIKNKFYVKNLKRNSSSFIWF